MKGLSNKEFETLVSELKSLVGCRLQEVGEDKECFLLNFWKAEQGVRTWYLDLSPRRPLFIEVPKPRKARSPVKKKPITLFIKAHIEGRILNDVQWEPDLGRVFLLNFGEGRLLEFRLYTGGANLIATTEEKKLSYRKPAELKSLAWIPGEGSDRNLAEIYEQAFASKNKNSSTKEADTEKHQKKMLKAIAKLEEDIADKKNKDWKAKGEKLLLEGKAPEAQKAFQKSKDVKAKIQRAEARLQELKKELVEGPGPQQAKQKPARFQAGVKGRTKTLSSGHQLFIGKNAADNLKILRAASAWDFWLHLRDYPGAHAIVRRHKKEKLSPSVFQEAAQLLIQEHLKKKAAELTGEKFDVILAEVRYVRPIKGDKLGRVNYSHEMTLSVALS